MAGLLALDLATHTGWAHLARPDVPPVHGSFRIGQPGFGDGAFFDAAEAEIIELIQHTSPNFIYYESAYIRGAVNLRTVLRLSGIAAIADKLGFQMGGIEPIRVPVSTIKKHFTSNGRAKKPEIIEKCESYGWDPEDDDAADALALLHFAACHLKYAGWDCLGIPDTCRGMAA